MPQAVVTKTISELKRDCQETHHSWKDQPWLFRQIRKVSILVTWLLLHTPLTPNAITLIAIAGGVLTAVLFAFGYWITGVIALLVVIILDFSDGEVSRYHGTQSKEGSYLDKIYIFAVHPSPIAGMTIGAYSIDPSQWVLIAGFIDVISVFLLCMVTEYAVQIVVWKHCRRFMDRLVKDPAYFAQQLQIASASAQDDTARVHQANAFDNFRDGKLATIARRLASGWDFPYILCYLAAAIVLQLVIGGRNGLAGIGPMKLFLYFYAITYPPLIGAMLLKNVATRTVERHFGEAKHEIMRVVQRARQT